MAARSVLVTGAAGFIGSHTTELLLSHGDQVVGLDNFNDYYSPSQKRENAELLTAQPGFTLAEGDVRNTALVKRLFSTHRFDVVIHLAAMAGVRASVEAPAHYFDVNLNGTLTLLEAARSFQKPHFVFASTSSAYGRTPRIPFAEEDAAAHPLAPYPASKRSAELLGHAYHHMHGMSFTALRFFTVYGPRNRPDMLAHLALDAAYGKRELTLYEGGNMHRDWTFVEDIADGVVRASQRRLGYQIINLGRGEPVLLRDFVQQVSERVGRPIHHRSRPMPAADVSRTWANVDKARRLLGYAPTTSVNEGIDRLCSWYQAHRI